MKAASIHLVRDLVLIILNHIVGLGSEVQARALDHGNHVVGRLSFRHIGLETRSHEFYGLASETGQPGVQHERYQGDDCFVIWPENYTRLKISNLKIIDSFKMVIFYGNSSID